MLSIKADRSTDTHTITLYTRNRSHRVPPPLSLAMVWPKRSMTPAREMPPMTTNRPMSRMMV